MYFSIEESMLDNDRLVIGTPEYNKARYPNPKKGKPFWLTQIQRRMETRALVASRNRPGGRGYTRREGGLIVTSKGHEFQGNLVQCVATSLHFKTKSFEYVPSTGKMFAYGHEIATVDRSTGILSFTLKYINDGKTRYRLRTFGINVTGNEKKTVWSIRIGKEKLASLCEKYGGIEGLRYSYRNIFTSISVEPTEYATCVYLKLGLRKDLYYKCGNRRDSLKIYFTEISGCDTDLFDEVLEDDRQVVQSELPFNGDEKSNFANLAESFSRYLGQRRANTIAFTQFARRIEQGDEDEFVEVESLDLPEGF